MIGFGIWEKGWLQHFWPKMCSSYTRMGKTMGRVDFWRKIRSLIWGMLSLRCLVDTTLRLLWVYLTFLVGLWEQTSLYNIYIYIYFVFLSFIHTIYIHTHTIYMCVYCISVFLCSILGTFPRKLSSKWLIP